jgi:hypothetical protein
MNAIPTLLEDAGFVAAALGSTTFVFAKDSPGGAPAVYAYDELAGARLTKISGDLVNGFGAPISTVDPVLPIPWIRYGTPGDCQLGRIVYTGITPSLSSQPCGSDAEIYVAGTKANGDLIAVSANRVWVFTDSTADVVAADDMGTMVVIYDETNTPVKTVVGWSGNHALVHFACLASHPERCWNIPFSPNRLVPNDAAANGGEGAFALVSTSYSGTTQNITVFRTLGTGDTPQPLP